MQTGETDIITSWKLEALPDEILLSGSFCATKLKRIHNSRIAVDFKGRCLKQGKSNLIRRSVLNLFIVYVLDTWSSNLNAKFTLGECLL